ncbi:hypothetical protein WN55_05910 [Dufourea novaeangliae]|uniref:Uncharacterized protein n=1 Tax=Dufourea novaeangliae TaxID=178035 RepID=A0A154PPK2_DUFNO|nr:hypothetical protein WN55_05910 [Dufourea novaeangliae]
MSSRVFAHVQLKYSPYVHSGTNSFLFAINPKIDREHCEIMNTKKFVCASAAVIVLKLSAKSKNKESKINDGGTLHCLKTDNDIVEAIY